MESSASGVLGPILLVIFLAGCGLALIWLFGEPQHSRDSSLDDERSTRPTRPAPAGSKRPSFPPRGALRRWGCFSRTMLRLVLHHLSKALAVVSLGVLFGTGLAMLWRWFAGR